MQPSDQRLFLRSHLPTMFLFVISKQKPKKTSGCAAPCFSLTEPTFIFQTETKLFSLLKPAISILIFVNAKLITLSISGINHFSTKSFFFSIELKWWKKWAIKKFACKIWTWFVWRKTQDNNWTINIHDNCYLAHVCHSRSIVRLLLHHWLKMLSSLLGLLWSSTQFALIRQSITITSLCHTRTQQADVACSKKCNS